MKNKVKGFAYPDWVDHWQDYVDKLMDKSSRDIGKIFPHLAFDPIEDLPMSAKERKEMHEVMEKLGITKKEDRTTAKLILTSTPRIGRVSFEEIQLKNSKITIPWFEHEFMKEIIYGRPHLGNGICVNCKEYDKAWKNPNKNLKYQSEYYKGLNCMTCEKSIIVKAERDLKNETEEILELIIDGKKCDKRGRQIENEKERKI